MGALVIGVLSFLLFLQFQVFGIFGGDSGDVVTAAVLFGVAHPPGYPLYSALGWFASQIPLFTPAWRVGLLSSIPHAVTVAVVYLITYSFTKHRVSALFSALTLLGNYVFFLYSVTPEVFALLDVLFVFVWYVLFVHGTSPIPWVAGILGGIMGLSFSHHHMMVLILPSIGIMLIPRLRGTRLLPVLFYAVLGGLIGAMWYGYVPIAASTNPMIDWDHVTNIQKLLQLITRQDYGTFQSSGSYGESITERLIAVRAYLDFLRMDVGILVGFSALGLTYLWTRYRRLAIAVSSSLILFGPLFYFYASFPLINRFTLATFERFMLPTYILCSILGGIGIHMLFTYVRHPSLRRVVSIVILLYGVALIVHQTKIFAGIQHDATADNFGKDMLSTVSPNGYLLLSQDTALFITQYVRYALQYRPDTKVLHMSMLGSEDYRNTVERTYPKSIRYQDNQAPFSMGGFIKHHATISGVFTNSAFPLPDGWYWVPHGLLLQALPSDQLPDVDDMYKKNLGLWDSYSEPQSGILSRYKHMMVSDVANVYTNARLELAKALMKAGKFKEAKKELDAALLYDGDSSKIEVLKHRGIVRMALKDCEGAMNDFQASRDVAPFLQNDLYLYESVTKRSCDGDEKAADMLLEKYRTGQKPLEGLLEDL